MHHKSRRNIKRLQTGTTVLPFHDMNPRINSIEEEGAVLHCSKISAIKIVLEMQCYTTISESDTY